MSLRTVLTKETFLVVFALTAGLGAIIAIVAFATKHDGAGSTPTPTGMYIERDEKNGVTCYERRTYGGYSISCVRDVPDGGRPR